MTSTWIASLILAAGVVDDLRSRKVHNWLALLCLVIGLTSSVYFEGWYGLQTGMLSAAVALAVSAPLFVFKIVGGGDIKLFVAFAASVSWTAALMTGFYSLIWGAIFGLLQALLQKQGVALFSNIKTLAIQRKSEGLSLHKIPFTVALLVGWLTTLKLEGHI